MSSSDRARSITLRRDDRAPEVGRRHVGVDVQHAVVAPARVGAVGAHRDLTRGSTTAGRGGAARDGPGLELAGQPSERRQSSSRPREKAAPSAGNRGRLEGVGDRAHRLVGLVPRRVLADCDNAATTATTTRRPRAAAATRPIAGRRSLAGGPLRPPSQPVSQTHIPAGEAQRSV